MAKRVKLRPAIRANDQEFLDRVQAAVDELRPTFKALSKALSIIHTERDLLRGMNAQEIELDRELRRLDALARSYGSTLAGE
jgi:hypothetical protein